MAYKFSKGKRGLGDITFEDDSDTGIDFEADTIKLETAGNEVLVVTGSNVGIGTSTPDYTLDVAGNIGVNQYIYHNGDANTWINFSVNRIRINAGGNNFIDCQDESSAPHKVRINNGGNNIDFVIKDNSGNVYFTADASTSRIGIKTATPIAELDVAGKIAITAEVSTPDQPSDGQGYLYTKTDGKLYWRSYDVAETDLTQTGGGGGGSGDGLSVTSQKTADYTASNGDVVLVNLVGTASDITNVTITLPAASSDVQVVIKIVSAANGKTVTVDGNGAERIDGQSTKIMDSDYESMHLISDGSNWWRIS